MGVFEDLGVMVDGLEDDTAEEFGGDVEEIFRFDKILYQQRNTLYDSNTKKSYLSEIGFENSEIDKIYTELRLLGIGIGK